MPIVELLLDKVARGQPLAKHERQQLAAAAVRTRCLAERLDKALTVADAWAEYAAAHPEVYGDDGAAAPEPADEPDPFAGDAA